MNKNLQIIKKGLFASGMLIAVAFSKVNAQNWVSQIGGDKAEHNATYLGKHLSIDSKGNTFTTASFLGTPKATSTDGTEIQLTNASTSIHDFYISKSNSSGVFQWAYRFGGSGHDVSCAIGNDADDNVYVTGYFAGTVDFNPATGASATAQGGTDIFVLKLDGNGVFQWVKTFGSTSTSTTELGQSLAVDADNNILIAGSFATGSAVDFDPGTATANLTSEAGLDGFVLKLTPAGEFLWVKQIGGTGDGKPIGLTTDQSKNVYVTGSFTQNASFSASVTLTSSGSTTATANGFIAKYDQNGNLGWTRHISSTGVVVGNNLVADVSGSLVVTGQAAGVTDFGNGGISSGEGNNIFIAKYAAANGNFDWVKYTGSSGHELGYDVAVDSQGDIYAAGYFRETVDFGNGIVATAELSSSTPGATTDDGYILRLNTNGAITGFKQLGSTGTDRVTGIGLDANGNVYAMGIFAQTLQFFDGAPSSSLTFRGGSWDIFILKMSASTLPVRFAEFKAQATDGGNKIEWSTLSESNNDYFDVERSSDGIHYSSLTRVRGNGDSNIKQFYTFTDTEPLVGFNYYRLKQVDLDGLASYSKVVYVNRSLRPQSLSVYPNPTSDNITIEPAVAFQNASIKIMNTAGQVVLTQKGISGTSHKVDISQFNKGIYFVEFTANGTRESFKIVKN